MGTFAERSTAPRRSPAAPPPRDKAVPARRQAEHLGPTPGALAHDFAGIPLHPQLSVAAAHDVSEQEAQRAATAAIATPAAASTLHPVDPGIPSSAPAPAAVQDVLRTPGTSLEPPVHRFFERRFGHPLDGLVVHEGSAAEASAEAVGARAYAVGSQVVLGREAAAGGLRRAHLLAHEIAHVAQQTHPSGPAAPRVQRQPKAEDKGWLPELDAIFPRGGGLLREIDRTTLLIAIFGTALLEQHVRQIHADPQATAFTQAHGVPGVVALFDTRRGGKLDVPAATKALADTPARYQRKSLETLRLGPQAQAPAGQAPAQAPAAPAGPSFWFQDPATQQGGAGRNTTSSQRNQVHVESSLSQVGTDINVRFAYPATDVSAQGASRRVANAKTSILQAIAQVVGDVGSLPPAATAKERQEQEVARARLAEVLRGLTASAPLNVFIATEPGAHELATGTVAPVTDQVFVDLKDVGDRTRLQAAIRVPLVMLQGGMMPTKGGLKNVPAASADELKRTMLHEGIHALLIRQSSDANSIWAANSAGLTIEGDAGASAKFVELVRKYLISQEEVFAYTNEASLYPPVSPTKARYDSFISNVELFLKKRGLTMKTIPRKIPVTQKVGGKPVTWSIDYRMPSGKASLTADLSATIDLLLGAYPFG